MSLNGTVIEWDCHWMGLSLNGTVMSLNGTVMSLNGYVIEF